MNIFVSNISFKVREQALSELFSQYGEVTSVRIIKDKETKRILLVQYLGHLFCRFFLLLFRDGYAIHYIQQEAYR